MKQNCTRILQSRFYNCATVQFEFIEWHSTFENIRSSLASAHPATGRVPPTTRLLRHVLEDIMCDVMFYLQEPHRTVVFDTVCRQVNPQPPTPNPRRRTTQHARGKKPTPPPPPTSTS